MDWLKALLEAAKITDGALDVDALMQSIQAEFPKHAVPKDEFNSKVGELKAANKTIEDLKKANGDNAELQKQIGEYKEQVKQLQTSAANTAKTYALKEQLAKEGVLDPDYLIYKAGGIEKFTFDDSGKPTGLTEALKPYKEDKAMAHLFKQTPGYDPNAGGGGGKTNPFAKDTFNLTEQGRLFRENPAQAKTLAAAAGVTI